MLGSLPSNFIIGPTALKAFTDGSVRNVLEFGQTRGRVNVPGAGIVEGEAVALVGILGPLVRPADLTRSILRVRIVYSVHGRSRDRHRPHELQKAAEVSEHRRDHGPLVLAAREHVPVTGRLTAITPPQIHRRKSFTIRFPSVIGSRGGRDFLRGVTCFTYLLMSVTLPSGGLGSVA